MPRLLRTLALAGLAYGAWTWLKKLMDDQPQSAPESHSEPKPAPASPRPSPPAPVSSNGGSAPKAAASDATQANATKAELYERATELDIKGRSKMSKSELERAIREAG